MRVFRRKSPARTYSATPKKHYRQYKSNLREDFNHRCGYTDCQDLWWDSGTGFHIDHFAPKKPKLTNPSNLSKFKEKEHDYSNLVYVCPHVNRAKSNDWPSDDPLISIVGDNGYLDPCNVDLNEYFERTDAGKIMPKDNPVAKYMWSKLQLYLKRYEIYWRLDQLHEKKRKLIDLKQRLMLSAKQDDEIKNGIVELEIEYQKYIEYLA